MKKINVSPEACIGCGACVAIDPEHFGFNDEGLSKPISNENLESTELANAIDSCPTCAISMVDGNTCECEECKCDEECSCECKDCNGDCDCDCEECECTPENNCGCHCYVEE